MVAKRTLPERRNALLDPENSPTHEALAERRRLGQTNLAVKPGIAGATNATRGENLGTFDYAHLRVPLPKDLSGSGIFTLKTTTSYPESYFLMRRSSDGYISATGMFKAAFPWASLAEEEAERRFQKTFPSAGQEEVAGSVWIAPEEALHLAEEYGMRRWIVALLDPSPIEKGAKDRNNAHIQQPPLFDVNKATAPVVLPPTSALRPTRARSSRSASPSKTATPGRKIASPRKARTTRSTAKPESTNGTESKSESEVIKVVEAVQETKVVEETEVIDEPTGSPSSHLQQAIEDDATPAESVASEAEPSVNGDHKQPETVHIEVQETVEREGEVETTTTNVRIDVPLDYPELPTPEDPAKMIAEAKRMVAEARELDGQAAGGAVSSKSSKRKAEDLSRDEDEVEELIEERPAKRIAYTTEQKLTKEKVTRRALVGLGFMAALGYGFQYFA